MFPRCIFLQFMIRLHRNKKSNIHYDGLFRCGETAGVMSIWCCTTRMARKKSLGCKTKQERKHDEREHGSNLIQNTIKSARFL